MNQISVADAADRLGVGVQRVHQRIADGSLPAKKIGSQYVINEADLLPLGEMAHSPGRPLSVRSAIALLVAAEPERDRRQEILRAAVVGAANLSAPSPSDLSKARSRLRNLLIHSAAKNANDAEAAEQALHQCAAALRKTFARRAERRQYWASPRDLDDLRADARLRLAGLSDPDAGIASGDLVEAYVDEDALADLVDDFLLDESAANDGNVILHVAPASLSGVLKFKSSDGSGKSTALHSLLLAADLAEHRDPRSERRAVELLGGLHARLFPAGQGGEA